MKITSAVGRRLQIAILEPNRFHEEVLFAFVNAAARLPQNPEITVFAPNHWEANEFIHRDLGMCCSWLPFEDFARGTGLVPSFDLIIANTFPSPAGQAVLERMLNLGQPIFGLVHDIDFFIRLDGAEEALRRWPNLMIGHAGIIPPRNLGAFPAEMRQRISRFVPVLAFDRVRPNIENLVGVALPGALEFARRDISMAVRLTGRSGAPLRIFGRSKDQGDGPRLPRDLDADRQRLYSEIQDARASGIDIKMDVTCSDFYRTISNSRFVAVLPVHPDYLRGKLTGAVTAALSCGVPMIAGPDVYEHYTESAGQLFTDCMLRLDPIAPEGRNDEWGAIVWKTPQHRYVELCLATLRSRDHILDQNTSTLNSIVSALAEFGPTSEPDKPTCAAQ